MAGGRGPPAATRVSRLFPLACVRVSVQELQRDIQRHTEGVESVLGLCDALLRDQDAAGSAELEGDSVRETGRSLDQRWRTICALALDRRLRCEPQISSAPRSSQSPNP